MKTKAEVYKEAMAEAKKHEQGLYVGSNRIAWISDEGKLAISSSPPYFTSGEAIILAQWIIDNFSTQIKDLSNYDRVI